MTDFKEISRMIPKSGPWFSEQIMRRQKPSGNPPAGRRTGLRPWLALAGLCLCAATAAAAATDPVGEWMVTKGYARIRIENCGGALWGAVVWEQIPGGVDSKNPDATKRARPTLGLPVLLEMKPTGPNKWVGQIYNSEDGKTYDSNISLGSNPDVLQVRGCVLGILCGGEDWTRTVDPTLPPGSPGGPPLPPPPTAGSARPSGSATRPAPNGSNMARPGAPAAPSNATAAPPPIDYATASTADFCSAVLNNAGLTH
jgi:uncharacterized protein (DUF2147 family)